MEEEDSENMEPTKPDETQLAKQLQELIGQEKEATFTTPAEISDAKALGILISHWAWHDWDNRGTIAILEACGSALEDCNYHSAAATIRQLAEEVEGDQSPDQGKPPPPNESYTIQATLTYSKEPQPRIFNDPLPDDEDCPRCKGTGNLGQSSVPSVPIFCTECGGNGKARPKRP